MVAEMELIVPSRAVLIVRKGVILAVKREGFVCDRMSHLVPTGRMVS